MRPPPGPTFTFLLEFDMPTAVLIATSWHGPPGADRPTGVPLAQFGVVREMFLAAGWRMMLASPAGGAVPVDTGSRSEEVAAVHDQLADSVALRDLGGSGALLVSEVDAWVVLGGPGAMVDLPDDPFLARLLAPAMRRGRPVVALDHGAAALVAPWTPDGRPAVAGVRVTGRSDAEDRGGPHHHRVAAPSTEQRLRAAGARYSAGPAWEPHVVTDGPLVTAQNPASVRHALSLLLPTTPQQPRQAA